MRRLGHRLEGHTSRQVINRLKIRDRTGLFNGQHVVGVHHLCNAVKKFDPARHKTPGSCRDLAAQVIPACMEEHKLKRRLRIFHRDPIGPALAARRAVCANRDLDRNDPRQFRPLDRVTPTAIHHRIRQ